MSPNRNDSQCFVLHRNNFSDVYIGLHSKSNSETTGTNQLTWFGEVFNTSSYTNFGLTQPPSIIQEHSCVILKMAEGWKWNVVTDCKEKRDLVCDAPVRRDHLTDWFKQCPYGYRSVHFLTFHWPTITRSEQKRKYIGRQHIKLNFNWHG